MLLAVAGFMTCPANWYAVAIELRCYGRVREALGDRRVEWSLDGETTVCDLLSSLERSVERFDREALSGPDGLLVMRNRTHLHLTDRIADGDVIAISDSPMLE